MMRQAGHTLVEFMIAVTLAAMMSVGAVSLFANQTGVVRTETQRNEAMQEAQTAYDILSRLLRHAETASLDIRYGGGARPNQPAELERASDAITVDFRVPEGYAVWPNQSGADHYIRIRWSNAPGDNARYAIQVAAAQSPGLLNQAPLHTVSGSAAQGNPRILNLDLWPLRDRNSLQPAANDDPTAGYLLAVTSRTGNPDLSYDNPAAPADAALRHFRTFRAAGVVAPRN